MIQSEADLGGYNINDVTFYWTRDNESVSGLDSLQLAQYTVEDYYTSVSEAIYETGHYPKLVFYFELKRSILYFILETYVPSSLLVVLSWVSFWISLSSVPARVCIGVTTVLTMTTLMMGARTSLPNANCFIKAIDVYLGICFSFIFGALIEYAVAHFCTLSSTDTHMLMAVHTRNPTNLTELEMICKEEWSKIPSSRIQTQTLIYSHHIHDLDDEINGIVTTISSHAAATRRAKRRAAKEQASGTATASTELTITPSSPSGSEPKPEPSPPEHTHWCITVLATLRKLLLRSIRCCTVENPHHIDNYSRVIFPLSFVMVNLLYWTYYLYF
uniref:Neurotransmitter-gated ion-channel transmembrane domain-containing protein n=1 Tax=Knipowitschia caucasica TaxID=637954 RepID=A0AAV2JK15_KNICA